MTKRKIDKWLLVFMVVVGLACVGVMRSASADCGGGNGSDDPPAHGCDDGNGGGDNGEGGGDSMAESDANAQADANADASAGSESDASADASTGDQTVNLNQAKTTGRSYMSSGDATADCQKFGGISSGWVGGALGLGINFTDKECRLLKVYDRLVDRGLLLVANKALCDTRTLRKLYGKGGAGTCQAELTDSYQTSQDDVRDEVDDLRRMVRELSERSRTANTSSQGAESGETAEYGHNEPSQDAQDERSTLSEYQSTAENCEPCPDCEEQATRAFKACVAK